jgi:hypothetical protein
LAGSTGWTFRRYYTEGSAGVYYTFIDELKRLLNKTVIDDRGESGEKSVEEDQGKSLRKWKELLNLLLILDWTLYAEKYLSL